MIKVSKNEGSVCVKCAPSIMSSGKACSKLKPSAQTISISLYIYREREDE